MASLSEQLDAQIASFFSSWNIYTTVLALVLAGFIIYPLIFFEEPDTHPLLLARQARPAPVRQPGESAVYRSIESAYGYPLRSGLNVKDADSPRWSMGRDGDLRDVWRSTVAGGAQGEKSLIMTVYGKESAEDHDIAEISKSINVVGKHLRKSGKKVAIYLPNCVEYLSTVFASAFYGLSTVLLPYNQPHETVVDLIKRTGADCLVAEAGSLPLDMLTSSKVKSIIWVVPKASRHMDWTDVKGPAALSTWHDLIVESDATAELPKNDVEPGSLTQIWLTQQGVPGKIVEFTQGNLVAAIAGLGVAIPQKQRVGPGDLVLPADSFSSTYVLCNVMATLYSHASLAINSVAGPGVDLKLASRTISPTVIIASAETMAAIHQKETGAITGTMQRYAHVSQSQAMTAGRMPTDRWLFKLVAPPSSAAGGRPGQLRLILVAERLGTDAPALSSHMLSDLRIFNKARICYALTAPEVAGAVAQTNLYDYRMEKTAGHSHFGVPLSCCEIKLTSANDQDVDGNSPKGEINVMGPSVAGGEVKLGVKGQFREDCTLAYA
ncbi:hypothetical protein K461DRAFT_284034 [Myriangium duriaei CBS 260.36]|uniref:AMP-dependent synthetase/ligase domain-containing protein n=1 Tax=Myriangium duriaei CBS 260.36 TaxID=1168546 RepID=A0A9P4MLI6_9PEZI|nr:hypothetical protein K461DRAFT_284034 [Myriangium duriaei CBS 260.36]